MSQSEGLALPAQPVSLSPLPTPLKIPRYCLGSYPGEVRYLAFSPEVGSPYFVLDGGNTPPKLVETTTGKILYTFGNNRERQRYAASTACFSPEGKLVATATGRGTLCLWEVATGQLRVELPGLNESIRSLAFCNGGTQLLASTFGGSACLWDIAIGKVTSQLEVKQSFEMLVNQAGQMLAYGRDQPITIWEVESGKCLNSIEAGTSHFWIKAFSQDGSKFVFCTRKGCLVAGVAEAKALVTLDHGEEQVRAASFSPDGEFLLTSATDRVVRLWNLAGQLLDSYPVFDSYHSPGALALSSDNKLVLTGAQTAALWEVTPSLETITTNSPGLINHFNGHRSYVSAATFSADGILLATASQDGTARLWQSATGELEHPLTGHDEGVTSLAFSPAGDLLATASKDSTVRLYQLGRSEALGVMEGHNGWVRCLAFSKDGKYLASGGEDGQLLLWEVAVAGKAKPVGSFFHSSGWITACLFQTQVKRLLVGTSDGQLKVWDIPTSQLLLTKVVAKGRMRQVALDEQTRLALYGTDRGELGLSELENGEQVAKLIGLEDQPVTLLSLSPQRRYVVAGYNDGQVFVWHYPSLKLASLYKTAYTPRAIYWQTARRAMLADRGGTDGQPGRYWLELE